MKYRDPRRIESKIFRNPISILPEIYLPHIAWDLTWIRWLILPTVAATVRISFRGVDQNGTSLVVKELKSPITSAEKLKRPVPARGLPDDFGRKYLGLESSRF